jgi:hypothetical protein
VIPDWTPGPEREKKPFAEMEAEFERRMAEFDKAIEEWLGDKLVNGNNWIGGGGNAL